MTFSYSVKTVNDETTTWATRMDHYYAIGKYDVHMKQILISLGIMAVSSALACGYVNMSVTRDFARLYGARSSRTHGRVASLERHPGGADGSAGGYGGLEILSDATELVGWSRLKDDVFRAPS